MDDWKELQMELEVIEDLEKMEDFKQRIRKTTGRLSTDHKNIKEMDEEDDKIGIMNLMELREASITQPRQSGNPEKAPKKKRRTKR